ncbi:MAG: DinB family protein [Saprospiraceae bacterium]|nr:DinB family protein [Saprospiraceae bacterium]
MKNILTTYTAFNLWANEVMINWLKAYPEALLTEPTPSSFPTLRETLLHIWSAEKAWLERLRNEPTSTFLQFEYQGDNQGIFEGLLAKSTDFNAYCQSLSDSDWQQAVPFRLLNGTEDARPRHDMVHHCMNHSTYHRGQLVTMGRALGMENPPSTDQMRYFRSL